MNRNFLRLASSALAALPLAAMALTPAVTFHVDGLRSATAEASTAHFSAPAREAAAGELITEAPAGKGTQYTREAITFIVMGGMAFSNPDNAGASTVVDGDDGFVYISHPYASLVTNSWLKGQRVGDDRIVVNLPQLIYREEFDGETYDYYAYRMELLPGGEGENTSWYYPTESQQLVYHIDGDGFYMETNDDETLLLGLCDSDGGWTGHGDISQNYTPFTGTLCSLPDGLTEQPWQARIGATGYYLTYAGEGDDVYVKGFAEVFPDTWVHGVKGTDGVHFPAGQYLGVDAGTQHHIFLTGGDKEPYWNEEYEMELTHNVLADNITFAEEDDALNIASTILINKGMQGYNPLVTLTEMELRANPEVTVPYPMNPTLNGLIEYNEDWGFGVLMFNIPTLNMDGYLLPSDKMSYMMYVDGEPWALYPDEYPGVEPETYLLDWAYDDGNFIRSFGVAHNFYYFAADFDTIGVQSVFERDGELYGSQVVYYDLNLSEITSIEGEEGVIASVEWYDLNGRRLASPAGLCVKLTRYADGTVKTEKHLAR